MKPVLETVEQDAGFAVSSGGKILMTPDKRMLVMPTQALAAAIAEEWLLQGKYIASKMPLTALAYTAIDRIADRHDEIVEVLLVYVDTDTLSYRATGSEALAKQQNEEWNPILEWAGKTLGATWEVTSGVMPLDQPEALHKAIAKRLRSLDNMRLASACQLSSGYSSLVLAIAVLAKHISAEEAFRLSRLEEESQAEVWGRDAEADDRAARLKFEIMGAARFLDLLDAS